MLLDRGIRARCIRILAICGLATVSLSGCYPGDHRNFLENVGIEYTKDGDIFLVVCGESEGLESASGYLDGEPFSIELEDGARPSTRVKISGKFPGYTQSPYIDSAADRLHLMDSSGVAGFGASTQKWLDLNSLQPGGVLDQDGRLTDASTWASRNQECR